MRTPLLFSLVFCLAAAVAQAQVTVGCGVADQACTGTDSLTLGQSNSLNASIFRGEDASGSRRQFIISKAALNAQGFTGGTIKDLAVRVTSNRANWYHNFKVSLGCVDSNTTTLNEFYPTPTVVFTADSIDPQKGWYHFPFTGNGFAWNGLSSLVFETCFGNSGLNNPISDTLAGAGVSNQTWIVNVTDGSIPCASVAGQFTFAFKPVFRLYFCDALTTSTFESVEALSNTSSLFPNPTKGRFQVSGVQFPYQVEVSNLMGQVVFTKEVKSASEEALLMAYTGIFMVKVQAGNLVQNFRLVLEQ